MGEVMRAAMKSFLLISIVVPSYAHAQFMRKRNLQVGSSSLHYLNTSKAFEELNDIDFQYSQDFYAMQLGCDVQLNQKFCGAASVACVLNSLMEDGELPIDPVYAPYNYATGADLVSNDNAISRDCVDKNVVHVEESFIGVNYPPYGLVLDQAEQLVKCYLDSAKYSVRAVHVDGNVTVDQVRSDLKQALKTDHNRVFVNFHRASIGQVGGGHFSPIVAFNPKEDSFLIYDVARYKYSPFWAPAKNVHASLQTVDSCGNWNFPLRQKEIMSTLLDPDVDYQTATQELGCKPAYRGYIIVESKPASIENPESTFAAFEDTMLRSSIP